MSELVLAGALPVANQLPCSNCNGSLTATVVFFADDEECGV